MNYTTKMTLLALGLFTSSALELSTSEQIMSEIKT